MSSLPFTTVLSHIEQTSQIIFTWLASRAGRWTTSCTVIGYLKGQGGAIFPAVSSKKNGNLLNLYTTVQLLEVIATFCTKTE